MVKIFVSYSHDDEAVAQSIEGYLRKAYDDVWYDEKLHTGDTWWERIVGKIENCSHFIFLMSNESLKSEYCQKELAFARQKGKTILPIKVRRSIHLPDDLKYLEDLQICEMLGKVTIDSLNELYAAIIRKSEGIEYQQTLAAKLRQADLRVVKTLWPLISSRVIQQLRLDIVSGIPISLSDYFKTIDEYKELRRRPEYQMYSLILQNAFDEFDKYLIELDDLLSQTYEMDDTYTNWLPIELDKIDWKIRSRLDDSQTNIMDKLRVLSMKIRTELPEFTFPIE